jgi:hypothetical protein
MANILLPRQIQVKRSRLMRHQAEGLQVGNRVVSLRIKGSLDHLNL